MASLVLSRLTVSPDDGASRELVRQALAQAAATATGRALSADFIEQRGSAAVTLEPGTQPESPRAETDVWHGLPHIRIDPKPAQDLSWVLAHELFGHVLRDAQARQAGVEPAYGVYAGNELEASLVGWVIAAESGRGPDQAAAQFLRDPQDYRDRLEVSATLYAGALPLGSMKDPLPTLKRRRARCDRYLKSLDAALRKPHLPEAKRIAYARSKTMIGSTARALDEMIARYSSADGRLHLEQISMSLDTEAGARFFALAESRIQALTRRFRRLAPRPPKR